MYVFRHNCLGAFSIFRNLMWSIKDTNVKLLTDKCITRRLLFVINAFSHPWGIQPSSQVIRALAPKDVAWNEALREGIYFYPIFHIMACSQAAKGVVDEKNSSVDTCSLFKSTLHKRKVDPFHLVCRQTLMINNDELVSVRTVIDLKIRFTTENWIGNIFSCLSVT